MILAADVGGTKTNLAFFEVREKGLVVVEQARYASRDFNSLDELALHFLSEHRLQAQHACFAAAGPCHQGICEATNLPWHIDARKLQTELGIESALVINDLEATAKCAVCVDSLDLFVSLYGAEAGNLALKVMATGGVYIGGGELPQRKVV